VPALRKLKISGRRYAEPVEVEFPNVRVETGRKLS
jgi:hypothetical protein